MITEFHLILINKILTGSFSKKIPKPKAETSWEKYARIKGIVKKKRGKMIFDEQSKEWKPRWGYKRGNTDQNDWLIEHKPSETGDFEDPFLKRKVDKRERIQAQDKREKKNQYRSDKKNSSQYDKCLLFFQFFFF